MATNPSAGTRSVTRVLDTVSTLEGGGFTVRRPFPTQTLDQIDPFLLFDHFGPVDHAPGEAKGAPDHPHRGFETVTYVIEGLWEHKDSAGNSGRLGAGDVQWMTAGAGVVHSEMPAAELLRKGGRVHGVQLWVNLPRRDKMMKPRYQDVPSSKIPVARSKDGAVSVKVIAGQSLGASAVIDTRTPILYLHATLEPGALFVQEVPRDFNAFAYVIEGEILGDEGGTRAAEGQAALFAGGESVSIAAPRKAAGPSQILLVAGRPLGEPVARYGPFVMNTREEILQAFADYQEGRMGIIPA